MSDLECDEVSVRFLTEIRTMGVKNEPDTVVLKITAGTDVVLYCLSVADLAGVAKQLAADAALMGAGPTGKVV